jgi:hypothetical protein
VQCTDKLEYSLSISNKLFYITGVLLKFTKVDNAIRHLVYAEMDLFLNVDKGLFALPIANIGKNHQHQTSEPYRHASRQNQMGSKHRHYRGALENVINPTHQHAIQEKTKKHLKQDKFQHKKDDKSMKEK